MDSHEIIRELERRANQLESEAQRLRAAVQVLRGDAPTVTSTTEASLPVAEHARPEVSRPTPKTMPLILETLGELGPTSNRELTAALLERGWVTTSAEPTNTVRTALGRLVQRERVTQLDGGLFALPQVESPAADA